jgi:hypothetical protein
LLGFISATLAHQRTTMSPKEEDFIRFYRDAVIAGHDDPAAETMRHFNLSRDYIVRLLNENRRLARRAVHEKPNGACDEHCTWHHRGRCR